MPHFSANLSYLFTDLPFVERFAAAARAGFEAVEFHFPYAYPADELAAAARDAGVEVVLFNLPPGDWDGGERGLACVPGREAEFARGVEVALEYAVALNCPRLNCLAGLRTPGVSLEQLDARLIDNLRLAAQRCAQVGRTLLVEPLNDRDTPGFHLTRSDQALALIERVGAPNLGLQFDFYHVQIMEGDLARRLAAALPRIGHVQFADNPGRGQPGSGEIRFEFLFAELDRLGYAGWVGAEYRPAGGDTLASLAWLHAARRTSGEGSVTVSA